jgi:hypothetical protein
LGRQRVAFQAVAREQEIVEDRERGEHAMAFDDMDEARIDGLARAGGRYVLAAEGDLAGARQQARHGLQQRGLAGAIGAEQRHDLAGADREVDAVQHADLAVAGRQASHGEQGIRRRDRH